MFRTIRKKFGQNSDNIRTKFRQNSDKIRKKSDKIRTTFEQNSDKFRKKSDKFRTKFDKIRQNSDKCPLLRWWRHICRTIVPTLKSILQIVVEMSRWEYENMSEICKGIIIWTCVKFFIIIYFRPGTQNSEKKEIQSGLTIV